MKLQGSLRNTLVFLLSIFYTMKLGETRALEWCWTRPSLDAKVIPHAQGINWALCEGQNINLEQIAKGEIPADDSSDSGKSCQGQDGPRAKYEIKVNMPQDEAFVGNSGPYYMTINSDSMQGEEFELISRAFIPGQQEKIVKEITNVGEVSSLTIRQADQDDGPFACKKVVIVSGASEWQFTCNSVLDRNRKVMNLDLNPKNIVTLTILQNQEQKMKDKGYFPLAIALQGQKGITPFQLIDMYQIDGKQRVFTTEYQEVGPLIKLHLKSYFKTGYTKTLNIAQVTVQVEGEGGPFKYLFLNHNQVKISKNLSQIELTTGGQNPKASRNNLSPQAKPGQMDQEDVKPNSQPQQPVTDFQNGLEDHELKNLKQVDCAALGTTVFGNIDFFTDAVNYQVNYVVCPPACNDSSSVMGRSVYHPDSTVCAAGIVDGSIGRGGGLMGVIMVSGQKRFDQRPQSHGITISQGNESKWGFTTVKVNNPDFSKSDVRIIDHTGVPSFEGRVEFRVGGHWGTVAREGSSNAFARQVCRVLNYKDGDIINDKRGFCREYRNKDYCGFRGQPVHYSHYECSETITTLQQCTRQVSTLVDHDEDVIIRCSNIDKKNQHEVSPQDGTVRLIGATGSPTTTNQGRIEIYRDSKWGSFCSQGFTSRSAQVACRQMGYDDGGILGGVENSFKACESGEYNYCASEMSQLILTNVACVDQSKLGDCGGQNTQDCALEMTAVIECVGDKGDTTGNSQQEKQEDQVYPPLLGTLPLANPYILNCDTKIDDYLFEGDPGSIYVSFCPPGCVNSPSILYGTTVYSDQTSICKAAIHAGVIQDQGGFVTVKIVWPFKNFKASRMNGLSSQTQNWSSKAFQPTRTINWHKRLSLEQYSAPARGLIAPFSKKLEGSSRQDPVSFIQVSGRYIIVDSVHLSKKFKNYLLKKSFLQLKQAPEDNPPSFLWASPQDYKFSKENIIDTKGLEKNEDLKNLDSFTIMTQFKLEKMVEVGGNLQPALIIGHSDHNCWSLVVNSQGLSFGKLDAMQLLGYTVAKDRQVHIAIVYNKSEKSLKSYIKELGQDTIIKENLGVNFDFTCAGQVNIGRNALQDNMNFYGEIHYVKVFNSNLEEDAIEELLSKPIPKALKPAEEASCNSQGILKYTIDRRQCVQPCTRDIPPPSVKAPIPPEEARIAQPNVIMDQLSDMGMQQDDGSFMNGPSSDAFQINCEDTILTREFLGEVGKQYKIYCNKDCPKDAGFLFGSQVYNENSSICLAAIHDGKIEQERGGEFYLLLVKHPQTYYGSTSNGIQSTTLEMEKEHKAFTLENASASIDVDCKIDASDEKLWGQLSGLKTFICPKNCSKISHNVHNHLTSYYYKSSVCQAAIHAGILTDLGGEIKLIFQEPSKIYEGSYNAGINGTPYINHDLRGKSFKINGQVRSSHNYFNKDFDRSKIFTQYEVIEALTLVNGPSNWDMVEFPYAPHQLVLQNNSVAEDGQSKPEYGSILKRLDFEGENGLMKVNLYYDNLSNGFQAKAPEAGILFRYYDKSNYYVLKLNAPERQGIELFKKENGQEHLLATKGDSVVFDVWYRYYIVFQEQNIKIYRQVGNIRRIEQLFDYTETSKGIGRGYVALATNGDSRTLYFDALSVQQYEPAFGIIAQKEVNHREYFECVLPKSVKKRNKFFQETYHTKESPGMYFFLEQEHSVAFLLLIMLYQECRGLGKTDFL